MPEPSTSRIFIEIPAPTDRNRVVTDRDWIAPVIRAMLGGAQAWLDGAGLLVEPVIHADGAWTETPMPEPSTSLREAIKAALWSCANSHPGTDLRSVFERQTDAVLRVTGPDKAAAVAAAIGEHEDSMAVYRVEREQLKVTAAVAAERERITQAITALYDTPPCEGAYRVDGMWYHGSGSSRVGIIGTVNEADVLSAVRGVEANKETG